MSWLSGRLNAALVSPSQLPGSNYPDLQIGPMADAVQLKRTYRGYTFYLAGFGSNDTTTILQVAQNPSWLVPYISCSLIVLGLLLQFGMHLVGFVRHRIIA